MGNRILAGARFAQRRAIMPTHEILVAIDFATLLFPRCSHCFVHTILKQEAMSAGTRAPSEARVKRLLEQHRASSQAGRSARSAKRKSRTGIADAKVNRV